MISMLAWIDWYEKFKCKLFVRMYTLNYIDSYQIQLFVVISNKITTWVY